jgi:hypothetical protein
MMSRRWRWRCAEDEDEEQEKEEQGGRRRRRGRDGRSARGECGRLRVVFGATEIPLHVK